MKLGYEGLDVYQLALDFLVVANGVIEGLLPLIQLPSNHAGHPMEHTAHRMDSHFLPSPCTGTFTFTFTGGPIQGQSTTRPKLGRPGRPVRPCSPMRRSCEVCRSFRSGNSAESPAAELVEFEFGKRTVALCATHAYIFRWSRVTTFEGLRKLFGESNGKRSYVPRRIRSDEPRSAERRKRNAGRRASDRPQN